MERDLPARMVNLDLLKAIALYALDLKGRSLPRLRREIEHHDNPAAKQFLRDYFERGLTIDVQSWCAQHAAQFDLQIADTQQAGSRPTVMQKGGRCL
jgi:hypothetical protein